MIDSMRLINLNKYNKQKLLNKSGIDGYYEQLNPFVRWILTVGRDNKIVLWKLFDGKIMHTDLAQSLFFAS